MVGFTLHLCTCGEMRLWYAVGMMLEVERTNVQGHSVELGGVIENEMSVMT